MHRPVAPFAALCLVAVLAACGSTVPQAERAGLSGSSGLDVAAPSAGGGPGTGGAGLVPGGRVPSGEAREGAGSVATDVPAQRVESEGARPESPVALARTPIRVGITYVKDAAAGFQALGIQGATLGDMRLYAQTLVDDLNARGGLGGRKVVPVYFAYDVNPGTPSYDRQDAAACAAFTQDALVEVAVVNFAGTVLNECLQRKGIPMLADGPTAGISEATLRRFDKLVVLGGFAMNRRAREQVRALSRLGYFTGWDTVQGGAGAAPVRIGIVTYDLPDYADSAKGPLSSGLVAAGFPKPQVVLVAPHDSYDNLSAMQAQISSAVLSFRSAGVTHVLVWDDNGVATLFFMNQAENQGYRPRYGINSGNNMQTLSKGLVSAEQLEGSVGMGWVPDFDTPAAADPSGPYANSARRACYALMKRKQVAGGAGFNETSAMMYCSAVQALEQAWSSMPRPAAAGLIAAVESFGTAFVDPQVPSTYLAPGRHDGLGGVYDYRYDSDCSCMVYRGGVRPLARS